jgi:hypothetical protein
LARPVLPESISHEQILEAALGGALVAVAQEFPHGGGWPTTLPTNDLRRIVEKGIARGFRWLTADIHERVEALRAYEVKITEGADKRT